MALPNTTFTGYSPDRMRQLAQSYGYNDANLAGFGKFLEANPARAKQYFDQQNMDMFGAERMRQFQAGGAVTPIPNPWQSQIAETKRDLKQWSGGTEDDTAGEQRVQELEQQLKGYEQQWQQYQTDQQLKQDANTGTQVPVTQDPVTQDPVTQDPSTGTERGIPTRVAGTPKSDRPDFGFKGQRGAGMQVIENWYNPKTGESYTAGQPGALPPSADWTTNPNESQATRDLRHANWNTIAKEWTTRQAQWNEQGQYIGPEQPVESDRGSYNYYIDPSQNVGNSPPAWESQQQQQQQQQQQPQPAQYPGIAQETVAKILQPQLPPETAFQPTYTPFEQAQLLGPYTGQVAGDRRVPTSQAALAAQAGGPTTATAPTVEAATVTPQIQELPSTAQELLAPTKTVEAQTETQTQVSNVQAAQDIEPITVQAPTSRVKQPGEEIDLPTDQADRAAEFIEQKAQAVTAAPTEAATVQGQLVTLLQQFEDGEVPVWASGAIRSAQAILQQRGLGASSIAGQAIVQAAMEAALPIAQLDAATVAKFEAQNLTNRQQAAMVQAQYRAQFMGQEFDIAFQTRVQNAAKIADIANRNFTADQQIALENSRFAQTVDLENLKNKQALILAQASALANLDIANLNNRQQAQVQNAQNVLQLDVQNLTNAQQSAMLSSQQQAQALLTDVAAENTALQLNAKSQQQTDQFYDNLVTNISQFNAGQANAIHQFNAGQVNSLNRFNSELVNQRDQFNAKNQLAINQSNAVWRREIATMDTAAANFANQTNAQNLLNISNQAYNNLWQEYRDVMNFAWQSGESEENRLQQLQLTQLQLKNKTELTELVSERERAKGIGGFLSSILTPFAETGITVLGTALLTGAKTILKGA
jgi:hypothetical protein